MRAPYYRREDVEAMAVALLCRLAAWHGGPLALPVDVDAVAEQILGLSWLYEPIPEPPGTTVFAALHPERRLVVLNERHVEAFGRNEGLERFTKAHELGHWVCHVEAGDGRQPAVDPAPISPWRSRRSVAGASSTPPAAEREWQERHANWFATALLMPPLPLRRAAAGIDVTAWRGRYALRERCGVSISALNARLSQLGYPAVR